MTKILDHKTIDRAPLVEDVVFITPAGEAIFEVVALDEVYGEFVQVRPLDPRDERPAFWASLTYVRVIDDEDPRAWA